MGTLFAEVAEEISCQELVERLGGETTEDSGTLLATCLGHEQRTPSMWVWPDHFKCYECDAGGGVVEMARLYLSSRRGRVVTHVEAAHWLRALAADINTAH